MLKTKRGCFKKAIESIGKDKAKNIVQGTETCWFHWLNRVMEEKKERKRACGICIPCIVRRTGLQDNNYEWDLRKDEVRNNESLGMAFRSYFGFLEQVAKTENSHSEFFKLLPASGKNLVATEDAISLEDLHSLFLTFSKEFMETFEI